MDTYAGTDDEEFMKPHASSVSNLWDSVASFTRETASILNPEYRGSFPCSSAAQLVQIKMGRAIRSRFAQNHEGLTSKKISRTSP